MSKIELANLDQLRTVVAGVVAEPGEAGYSEAVAIWNGSIERRPSVVVRCRTAGDVSAAINYARHRGLEVSVRGGGHGFSGFALTDGGLMIDLSPMKSVEVHPASKRARAGGGVTWGEIDAATQKHGLAVPGGMISHTGIAGLTLGGGIGWLCSIAGLSCDNLVGAEIVTADGEIRRVAETENPDLLWALKGGGGNFGVVTTFEYRLHDVGPDVNFAMFFWPLEEGRDALRFIRDYVRALPLDAAPFVASTNAPSAPFVPHALWAQPGWVLAVATFGSSDAHREVITPLGNANPRPSFDLVEKVSYVELQCMFDHTAPWGALAYEKAVHLDELTDEVIDVLVAHQGKKTAPLSFTPILVAGGAFAEVPEADTAFSGNRSARYVVNVTAVCTDRKTFEADRAWVRNYWTDLVPHAVSSGSYVNFMSEFDADRVRSAYGADKYDRLAELKARYDPDNFFHLNANIPPASARPHS